MTTRADKPTDSYMTAVKIIDSNASPSQLFRAKHPAIKTRTGAVENKKRNEIERQKRATTDTCMIKIREAGKMESEKKRKETR
ncbi:hypothetical protein BaRGS_00003133 [Batillaria attramentaria]|uniref:Uncharacterized protein n=1 Tax=Batillaria attramentaria TaxID=370345 RepID=A0ABD0M2D7_9CAEN